MKQFWKLYKRSVTDFPLHCKEAWGAGIDFSAHLLVLSFPITYPVLYPLVIAWARVMKRLKP